MLRFLECALVASSQLAPILEKCLAAFGDPVQPVLVLFALTALPHLEALDCLLVAAHAMRLVWHGLIDTTLLSYVLTYIASQLFSAALMSTWFS